MANLDRAVEAWAETASGHLTVAKRLGFRLLDRSVRESLPHLLPPFIPEPEPGTYACQEYLLLEPDRSIFLDFSGSLALRDGVDFKGTIDSVSFVTYHSDSRSVGAITTFGVLQPDQLSGGDLKNSITSVVNSFQAESSEFLVPPIEKVDALIDAADIEGRLGFVPVFSPECLERVLLHHKNRIDNLVDLMLGVGSYPLEDRWEWNRQIVGEE